jgi:archaetidylinositol phosphate synthase
VTDIGEHVRVHDMLLGALERPALRWLAAHMPTWVKPDLLTGIGILGSVLVFLGYLLSRWSHGFLWLASVGFAVNWFGDSLDGTLARYRKIERPRYGYFIDHTVDAFTMVLVFIGLGLSPYVRLDLAGLGAVGYLLMSVLAHVGAFVSGKFQVSYVKIGPTELRVVAVGANNLVFFFGNPRLNLPVVPLTAFDLLVLLLAVALFVVFLVTAVRQARRWSRLDPAQEG